MIFRVTPYERSHRQQVLDLIFGSQYIYAHLDWHDTSHWIDTQKALMLVVWQHNHIVGFMAASEPLNETSWLRIVALDEKEEPQKLLRLLWDVVCVELKAKSVAALVVEDWILTYLPHLGFQYEEDIITLSRANHHTLPTRKSPSVQIRTVGMEDLPALTKVDHAAFRAPWQMSLFEIRQARRIAAVCRAALNDQSEIIGYQLSTLYNGAGHLARLAVLPNLQGMGIGSILLEDLILRFQQRNIHTITVNTQASNHRSQRLYARYNFYRNGYDLPVWIAQLDKK